MSRANAQLIQSLYDAFAAGNVGTVLGAFHPQIVWMEAEGSPYAEGNPYVGPQQVAEGLFARLATEWDGFSIRLDRLIADGETVAALGRCRGVFRSTGRVLDAPFCDVWTVQGGKVVAFQQYIDSAQLVRVMQAVVPPPLLA